MTAAPKRYDIPKQTSATLCRGCSAWICFVPTEGGKQMPVEAQGDKRGESHFIHCPKSKEFSGKGQRDLFGGDK